MVKIEKNWSAHSSSEESEKGNELTNLVGRWNVGIYVTITRPFTYSKGPVKRTTFSNANLKYK